MTHIDEKTLELYVLGSFPLGLERGDIEEHLAKCAGCAALLQEIEAYYHDVKAIRSEQAKIFPEALAVHSMLMPAPPSPFMGRMSQATLTRPARFLLFIIQHPAASSAGFLAFFAAAVFAVSTLVTFKDTNLSYARARDGFLVAYNKEGDVLWRKEAGPGYDMDNLRKLSALEPVDYLATMDVDHDGSLEVIAIFTGFIPLPGISQNTIYCYNKDGTKRWQYEIHRTMTFGTESFPDRYNFRYLAVGDFDKDNSVEVVAVASHNNYPSVILHFNATDGKVLHEYWHSGEIDRIYHKDIDGDGIEELMLPGQNNSFNLACLLVLDPRTMSGYGPATPAYRPTTVEPALEKYYLLFPRNDMQKIAHQNRNAARDVQFYHDGAIVVAVGELVETSLDYRMVLFHFTPSLVCTGVEGEDLFVGLHRKLEAEGKFTRKLDVAYWKELQQGVQYWDGEGFVNAPTMNKRYLNLAQK